MDLEEKAEYLMNRVLTRIGESKSILNSIFNKKKHKWLAKTCVETQRDSRILRILRKKNSSEKTEKEPRVYK